HREAEFILERWAGEEGGGSYEDLGPEQQAGLTARLTELMRTNTWDPESRTITIEPVRADAFRANLEHYTQVFREGTGDGAIPAGAVSDFDRLHRRAASLFWTSWSAAPNRPDDDVSYTNSWPHEALVGNRRAGETGVWTGGSIIMLLAGISAMAW